MYNNQAQIKEIQSIYNMPYLHQKQGFQELMQYNRVSIYVCSLSADSELCG